MRRSNLGSAAALLLAILLLLAPQTASAGWFSEVVGGFFANSMLGFVLEGANLLVGFVGYVLITLAASVVNFAFNFQQFLEVPVVQIGWTLTRDIANMAFILLMLVMAFGTILRMETYGYKKMLPRLVTMALLINFSLIISGVVLDVANSLAYFFVSAGGTATDAGREVNVGDNIMTALQAGAVAQIQNDIKLDDASNAVRGMVSKVIMVVFVQLILYLIIAFLLFAMGLMMIYRLISIWIMLIMAPFYWVSYAIPGYNRFNQWWMDFLKQAFFPAIMGFFIFLGMATAATLGSTNFEDSAKDVGGFWGTIISTIPMSMIMQYIVVISLLFYGLSISQSWGAAGAKMMLDVAKKTKGWAYGKTKTYAKRAAGRLAEKALYKEGEGGKRTELREGLQRLTGAGYGVGKAVGQALRLPTTLVEQRQKLIKGSEDKLKGNSTATLKTIFAGLDDMAKAAILRVLADRGDLEFVSEETLVDRKFKKDGSSRKFKDLSDTEKEAERAKLTAEEKGQIGKIDEDKMGGVTQARFEAALKFNGTAGLDKEILNAAPQFAEIVGKKIKDVIEKISPANAAKIQAGSLQLPQVQEAVKEALINNRWDGSQLASIGQKNPKALTDLMEFLNKMSDEEKSKMAKRTQDYIKAGGYITFTPPAPTPEAAPTPPPTPTPTPARGEI